MIIENKNTKQMYVCSRADAAKILGVSSRTLYCWENEKKMSHKYHNKGNIEFKITFRDPKVIKQKKGFRKL